MQNGSAGLGVIRDMERGQSGLCGASAVLLWVASVTKQRLGEVRWESQGCRQWGVAIQGYERRCAVAGLAARV